MQKQNGNEYCKWQKKHLVKNSINKTDDHHFFYYQHYLILLLFNNR